MGAGGELPLPALDDATTNLQASRVGQDDVYTLAGERSEFTMAPTSPLGGPAISTSGSFVSFLLCVLFVLLLLMNAIVAYMYFYQPAKLRATVQTPPPLNLSEDDPAMEPFVARPLVCSFHCVLEDPSATVLPPDGLCHFLFFNLPDTRAYTAWDKGPCGPMVTGAAKAAAQTKFGLAVHASRANDTDVDLRLESGVFAFARQWDANVRQHGVNYLRGTTDKLFRNYKHHLAVLKRFRTLQEHFKRQTGHLLKRNYILLGLQAIYDNFAAERPGIASFIKTLYTEYPLDLLVMNTHFWTWEPRCLVVGPTMLHAPANVSLPTISSVASLLPDAAVPDKIAVLLSFSAAVVGFLMPATWDESLRYASGCVEAHLYPATSLCHGGVDPPEEEPRSVVMLSRMLAADRSLMLAWDSKLTIQTKAKHVYDVYRRERFGWLVDDVERDDALAKCAALNFSIVRYVKAFMP